MTFTLRLLNAAKRCLSRRCVADKADGVKKVLSAQSKRILLPARRVDVAETIWLLDTAAARQLDPASGLKRMIKYVSRLYQRRDG